MTRVVTVFGGTRRVVQHLRKHELSVRIASRHPDRSRELFGSDDPQIQSVAADIHDQQAVADAVAGAYGVVNAAVWPNFYYTPTAAGKNTWLGLQGHLHRNLRRRRHVRVSCKE